MPATKSRSRELNGRGDLTLWKRFNGSMPCATRCRPASSPRPASKASCVRSPAITALSPSCRTSTTRCRRCRSASARVQLSRIADTYMKLWPVGSTALLFGQSAIRARTRSPLQDCRYCADQGSPRLSRKKAPTTTWLTIRQDAYHPISRETADHSMPYIVGAAVLDGEISVDSFDLEKVPCTTARASSPSRSRSAGAGTGHHCRWQARRAPRRAICRASRSS